MNYLSSISLSFIFVFLASNCSAQKSEYYYKSGDRYGTGKWYMGREIAHVMGYQGINWLERPEREIEENTSTLLTNMDIQSDDVIADIGAGSGYHVFKMAPKVQGGLVYAVDIQEEMLQSIRKKKSAEGIENIELVKGTEKSVKLPESAIDIVLMVDVYHEFSFPIEMLESIKSALKPNGRIYLIEYRAEDDSVPIKRLHKMNEAQAVKEFEASGFRLQKNIDNLPWQHCMVFIQE
ncbi:methyltransferase type 11 [Marivirga tractuosa]|uniref:Methyltransferase type 11 n=1 Tax=Marivirga tractuosa (strain ATCC 23168 / DSM 4126 / NBRC 15989 / NCIMB 1408 / VKM B-1430 / H-43) TaxID=643867 RepID=E4TM12_MARTH|nr:class I SAM-dependent methyltransferase [Marivirga tractuosa]ADR20303.1 Methyltransferase type 11 [Marivirga tractuosa DSM 4126]BDD15255.1 methyltransferase type 11 [Marivirga tractuosa]